MSADGHRSLAARAEILKLARLLNREPESLAYLADVPADAIRDLRDQVTEVLFASSSKTLTRLALASRLLPVGVVAAIAQHAFGPLLAARVAGLLEPKRAVEIATKLPPEFLADVAVELDPRRATDLLAVMPVPQVSVVTRELVKRQEHVTMGRFVGYMPDASLRALLGLIDDRGLLRIAFVLEHKERLDDLLELIGPNRLEALSETAADPELWPEVLDLLAHVGDAHRRELIELTRRRDPQLYGALEEFVRHRDPGLYDELVQSVEGGPPDAVSGSANSD